VEDNRVGYKQVEDNQAEGNQAEGNQAEGNQAEGSQAEGNQAEGNHLEEAVGADILEEVADKTVAVDTLAEVDMNFDQDQDRETETALGQFLYQSNIREHLSTSVLTEYLFLVPFHHFLSVRAH
jgi:hypothetical protein